VAGERRTEEISEATDVGAKRSVLVLHGASLNHGFRGAPLRRVHATRAYAALSIAGALAAPYNRGKSFPTRGDS
jgi:hypothetical protein